MPTRLSYPRKTNELEVTLAGPLGRTVAGVGGGLSFAHETLASMAADGLGLTLIPYRARLDEWASSYARQGWPEGTPEYLLRGYFDAAEASGDLTVMIDYACDSKRHDRLFGLPGGDYTALTEIKRCSSLATVALLSPEVVNTFALGSSQGCI
jgi:hypothetical protein